MKLNYKFMAIVYVNTPYGERKHGEIHGKYFIRKVREKDRMKIFDAWSINPDIISELQEKQIEELHFIRGNKKYIISIEKALDKGFEKTFSGGRTFYIPIQHMELTSIK